MNSTTAAAPNNGADTATTAKAGREPAKLLRRIGLTTYEVTIHFSSESKDTMTDKIRRTIEREVGKNA